MALIKCKACGKEISENAVACPSCGEPVEKKPKPMLEKNPIEKKTSRAGMLVLLLLVVVVLAIVAYNNMSQEEKGNVNRVITDTGLGKILPWSERAVSSVRDLANNSNIASVLIGYAHPTGRDATLKNFEADSSGDTVNAVFNMGYTGGIFRRQYDVVIKWSFSEGSSLGVQVLQDTSTIPIIGSQMRKIENFFQNDFYGRVLSNIK